VPLPVRSPSEPLSWERIRIGCGILFVIEIAVFLFMAAGTHGLIVPLPKPTSTDFVSFYAAGSLANAGTPALAYDQAAHYAAEQRVTQEGIEYNFFYYPPPFLLLCAAIAHLPYIVAFLVFEGGLCSSTCSSPAISWVTAITRLSCRSLPSLRYYGRWAWDRTRF
jgi:hypothetical protein